MQISYRYSLINVLRMTMWAHNWHCCCPLFKKLTIQIAKDMARKHWKHQTANLELCPLQSPFVESVSSSLKAPFKMLAVVLMNSTWAYTHENQDIWCNVGHVNSRNDWPHVWQQSGEHQQCEGWVKWRFLGTPLSQLFPEPFASFTVPWGSCFFTMRDWDGSA